MSNCRQLNGRVDILGPKPGDQFALYDKIPVHECTSYRNALTGKLSIDRTGEGPCVGSRLQP